MGHKPERVFFVYVRRETRATQAISVCQGAWVGLAELGLRLDEAKQLTAALQAQIVPAQVAMTGERRRWCVACGRGLASKGHYPTTFRVAVTCRTKAPGRVHHLVKVTAERAGLSAEVSPH